MSTVAILVRVVVGGGETLLNATPCPLSEKIFLPVTPVQIIPSVECAILFAPLPTATNVVPFHATPSPLSK